MVTANWKALIVAALLTAPPAVADFPFPQYLRHVRAAIHRAWAPPQRTSAAEATVVFEIGRTGTLGFLYLLASSGDTAYDRSALHAVNRASPFWPLPTEYPATHVCLSIRFVGTDVVNYPAAAPCGPPLTARGARAGSAPSRASPRERAVPERASG